MRPAVNLEECLSQGPGDMLPHPILQYRGPGERAHGPSLLPTPPTWQRLGPQTWCQMAVSRWPGSTGARAEGLLPVALATPPHPVPVGGPRPVQVTATPWAVPWKHVLPLIVQPCQAGGVSNFLGAVTHNTVTLENVANIFRKDKIPCICPHPGSFYFHCTQATCPGKTPLANPFLQHSSAPTLRPQARPATSPLPTCSPRASPAHVRGRL